MIKIFILFICLCVIFVTQYTEIIKAKQKCFEQRKNDIALLQREVCLDQQDRVRFKDMVTCKEAEERTLMNLHLCTIQTWIINTDIVLIYNKLTESYWTILGFVLPIIFFILYFRQKEQENKIKYVKRLH